MALGPFLYLLFLAQIFYQNHEIFLKRKGQKKLLSNMPSMIQVIVIQRTSIILSSVVDIWKRRRLGHMCEVGYRVQLYSCHRCRKIHTQPNLLHFFQPKNGEIKFFLDNFSFSYTFPTAPVHFPSSINPTIPLQSIQFVEIL